MTRDPDGPWVWYFAYGSNLDPRTFQGRRRMRPSAARRARLDGYRLVFDLPVGGGERGVANVRTAPGERVHGVAWRITGTDACFLDRTEGVHRGYYVRLPVRLVGDDHQPFDAFTYRSARGRRGRKPSARYLGLLLAGARHHGLCSEWLRHLRTIELARDERQPPQGELFGRKAEPETGRKAELETGRKAELETGRTAELETGLKNESETGRKARS